MKKKKKIISYQLKMGAQKAASGISASLMIFFVLMILSISFILFQLKEFQITKDIKDIRRLKNEIEELRSLNHHYKSKIKNELATHSRIYSVARELGLQEALNTPQVLVVEKNKLKDYAEKDKEISQ